MKTVQATVEVMKEMISCDEYLLVIIMGKITLYDCLI